MPVLIPFTADQNSYLIHIKLQNGKEVIIDLLPLKYYIENLSSENTPTSGDEIKMIKHLVSEVQLIRPDLADFITSMIHLTLQFSSVKS